MANPFFVRAEWDAEAGVFTSVTNIPGLTVEAETLADFLNIAEELAPLMLEANVPAEERPDGTPLLTWLELRTAA